MSQESGISHWLFKKRELATPPESLFPQTVEIRSRSGRWKLKNEPSGSSQFRTLHKLVATGEKRVWERCFSDEGLSSILQLRSLVFLHPLWASPTSLTSFKGAKLALSGFLCRIYPASPHPKLKGNDERVCFPTKQFQGLYSGFILDWLKRGSFALFWGYDRCNSFSHGPHGGRNADFPWFSCGSGYGSALGIEDFVRHSLRSRHKKITTYRLSKYRHHFFGGDTMFISSWKHSKTLHVSSYLSGWCLQKCFFVVDRSFPSEVFEPTTNRIYSTVSTRKSGLGLGRWFVHNIETRTKFGYSLLLCTNHIHNTGSRLFGTDCICQKELPRRGTCNCMLLYSFIITRGRPWSLDSFCLFFFLNGSPIFETGKYLNTTRLTLFLSF